MEIASPERIWLGKRWHLHLRDHRLRGFQVPREFDSHLFWPGDLEVQIDMDQMVKLQTPKITGRSSVHSTRVMVHLPGHRLPSKARTFHDFAVSFLILIQGQVQLLGSVNLTCFL